MVSLRLLDGFEVGRSRRPCGGEEGGIETVSFSGVKGGVVGFPERRQKRGPPWLGPIGHPFQRCVQRKLGRDSAQVGAEPNVQ